MAKTFVGPQLRQLRRDRRQTQAEMAKVLGISAGYVNLLENNERSLSLRILMAVADNYGVDWRDLVADKTSNLLAELRSVIKDPMFSATPDLTELRAAIDHAPRLVEQFLHLYGIHRNTLERLMRYGSSTAADRLLATSAEAVVHDFFRDNSNYFHDLEVAAEALRAAEGHEPDDIYATLKATSQHARHPHQATRYRGDDSSTTCVRQGKPHHLSVRGARSRKCNLPARSCAVPDRAAGSPQQADRKYQNHSRNKSRALSC